MKKVIEVHRTYVCTEGGKRWYRLEDLEGNFVMTVETEVTQEYAFELGKAYEVCIIE